VSNQPLSHDSRQADDTQHDHDRPGGATPESSRFRLIFFAVVGLTVLALVVNVLLSVLPDDSPQVAAVAETCSTTYKMGFGAIVGLIGGRTT
jgi:hypothetical protein